jgi:4-amino-4-deoxy-L-arabinose transferase-like glycosyltransferase
MTPRRRLGGALLLAGALGLAGLGQFYFLRRPEYGWDGLAFFVLAVLCFWAAARRLEPAHAPDRRVRLPSLETWLASHRIRIGLAGVGTGAVAVVTAVSASRAWDDPCGDLLLMWVVGIGLTMGAIVWPGRSAWARARSLLPRAVGWEWASVAVLTLAAFGLRAWALGSIPYTLGGDEGAHGMLALDVIEGRLGHPFLMGTMSMPTLYYWPLAGSLLLFGDSVFGLRMLSAIVGALTVPLWYGLARRVWDRRLALASAAFLAAYHYHIHYSRVAANNILDPFLALAIVWALDRGLQTGQTRPFAWAGLGLGLAIYSYTGARLLPLLLAAYVGWVWLTQERRPQGIARGLAVLAFVTVVTGAPMLRYTLAHPDDWSARINQVGILQSGWLAREPGLTGKSTATILAEQFLRAAGAFHAFPDRTVWYGLREPLLGAAAGAFLLLGMAWAASRWRARGSFLVLAWFWAVIIGGGMLTESPPSSQRLVLAIPPVALLVALGAERTLALAARVLGASQRAQRLALAAAILALCAFSIRTYVWHYTPQRIYGGENGRVATRLAIHLRERADGGQVYFFGPPRIYYSFGAIRFLARDVPGRDVVDTVQGPLDIVDPSRPAIFVFLPERAGELTWVKDVYPGGQVQTFRTGERTDFVAYTVDPTAASP